MSISRARAYLHEIQTVAHPSLTIDRPIETFASDSRFLNCPLSTNYPVRFMRLFRWRRLGIPLYLS